MTCLLPDVVTTTHQKILENFAPRAMAGSFPITVHYPLRLKYSCLTRVHLATNSQEQRYVVRAPRVEMTINLRSLSASDQGLVDTFFDSQKGAYDSTWDIAIDGNNYAAMRFQSDEIKWDETLPNRWSTSLVCFGTPPTFSSPPVTYPALASGAVTQRPWSKRRSYQTNYSDVDTAGVRHALAMRSGGFTNFPTGAARIWDLRYAAIRTTDAEAIAAFFVTTAGRYGSFSFTDPDTSVTYTGCRFDSDELELSYNGYNNCSLQVSIYKG